MVPLVRFKLLVVCKAWGQHRSLCLCIGKRTQVPHPNTSAKQPTECGTRACRLCASRDAGAGSGTHYPRNRSVDRLRRSSKKGLRGAGRSTHPQPHRRNPKPAIRTSHLQRLCPAVIAGPVLISGGVGVQIQQSSKAPTLRRQPPPAFSALPRMPQMPTSGGVLLALATDSLCC